MLGLRSGLGGVYGHRHVRLEPQVDGLVGQDQVPDDWVMEVLGAGRVDADVVGAPPASELVAAGGELTDELVQLAKFGGVDRSASRSL